MRTCCLCGEEIVPGNALRVASRFLCLECYTWILEHNEGCVKVEAEEPPVKKCVGCGKETQRTSASPARGIYPQCCDCERKELIDARKRNER